MALNPLYQCSTAPPARRRWTFSVNNRSVYSSLVQVMGDVLYGVKNFLVGSMGWTVKYSCDGTTGPSSSSDHTDRWTDATKARTRGATTSAACSFVVLTDVDGVDCLISFTGSGDNTMRLAYSATGAYVPAGTATFPATATDEAVAGLGVDLVDPTTSGDRVWNVMADRRSFRVWVYRDHRMVGALMGLEPITSALQSPGATFPATRWAFLTAPGSNGFVSGVPSGSQLGVARVNVASTGFTAIAKWEDEQATSVTGMPELQGGVAPIARAMSIWSDTSGAQGKLGNLLDWWFSLDTAQDGWLTPDRQWIHIFGGTGTGGGNGILWKWDGTTQPVVA